MGIYRLEEDAVVYRELQTYARALDSRRETLDEILREAMIQTAASYGLDYREQLFGPVNQALGAEERRQRMIYRFARGFYSKRYNPCSAFPGLPWKNDGRKGNAAV